VYEGSLKLGMASPGIGQPIERTWKGGTIGGEGGSTDRGQKEEG